jgi:P27 family predicted phage terminase small subunit
MSGTKLSGRKPSPTKLKILRGNPGKRKLPEEVEPEPCIPDPPKQLRGAALDEWKRVTPELYELGLLTELDRAALAAYCQAWRQWIEAEQTIEAIRAGKCSDPVISQPELFEDGSFNKAMLVKKRSTGNLAISPLLQIAHESMQLCVKFGECFGLNPRARANVVSTKKKSGGGEWDKFPRHKK